MINYAVIGTSWITETFIAAIMGWALWSKKILLRNKD